MAHFMPDDWDGVLAAFRALSTRAVLQEGDGPTWMFRKLCEWIVGHADTSFFAHQTDPDSDAVYGIWSGKEGAREQLFLTPDGLRAWMRDATVVASEADVIMAWGDREFLWPSRGFNGARNAKRYRHDVRYAAGALRANGCLKMSLKRVAEMLLDYGACEASTTGDEAT